MNLKNNQKGFTLIELVVVIVILGIIASIAVPKYLDLTTRADQANTRADQANSKYIEASVMMYFAQHVKADPNFTLTQAVTAYNAGSDAFFADGNTPTKSDGTAFTVALVAGALSVT